jgi:hypothetical protein
MSRPNTDDAFAAEASNMTDDELMDTWQTASEKERKNLSPLMN